VISSAIISPVDHHLVNLALGDAFNRTNFEFFRDPFPARTTVELSALVGRA